MSKKLLYFKLLSLFLLSSGNVNAQEYCAFDEINEVFLKKNPQIKQIADLSNRRIAEEMKSGKFLNRNTNQIYEIPIVIHLFVDNSPLGSQTNPSDEQIKKWIDYTNGLYANTYYQNNASVNYPFRLVLAQRTEDNKPTNGIIRLNYSNDTKYTTHGVNNETNNGYDAQDLIKTSFWDPNSYYNVYVFNKFDSGNSGLNGYARMPESAGTIYDYTVMRSGVVRENMATFGHEVGHALGLYHVFGNSSNTNCTETASSDPYTTGDFIADTAPTINGNYYFSKYLTNSPTSSIINHCTNQPFDDIVSNVLNYGAGGPNGRSILTQGQTDRSIAKFLEFRSSFLTSLALTPADGTSNIPVEACEVTGGSGHIRFDQLEFNTISKKGIIYNLHNDFTKSNNINSAYVTEVTEGQNYQLNITTSTNPNRRKVYIYIDYNGDGIFDADEVVLSNHELLGNITNLSTTITIPTTTKKNTPLRMRVVGDLSNIYNGYQHITYGACDSRVAGQVEDFTIIVKEATSTVWNGTSWSMGEPTLTKEAIVRGDLVIDQSNRITTNKFTLESGSVTINNYGAIIAPIIENKLSADKFVVTGNNSGLLQWGNNISASGEFTIIQESSPMIFNDAALWSSPVKNQNLREFSPNTLLKRFYKYNETTNKFASLFIEDPLYPNGNLENPASYNFEAGKGYHIRVGSDFPTTKPGKKHIGKFVGELNTGLFSIPVTKNNLGYNLIGNPYPAPIYANRILNTNSDISALYFWTQESPLTTNGYASNNYSSYTRAGGVQAAAGGKIPNGNIAIGQGFFVEMVNNPRNILLHNSFTGWDDKVIFHKNEEDTKRVRLDLFEGAQAKNQILVTYMQDATNGFDHQIDAKLNKMFNGSTLFSIIEGTPEKYVIQGRAPFTTEDTVQLGFEAKESAPYTIKLNSTENFEDQAIYLRDKELHQVVDLTKDHYTFDAQQGIYNDRFEIIYQNKTLSTSDLSKQDVVVYNTNNTLVLTSQKEITFVEVYDITGRKVIAKQSSNNRLVLSELKKNNQVLLIKVTTSDSKTTTLKTIF
ncbi:GEVED domain-containing protein [Empedobacter sp. 189-2]|uniref:GEVED domain-containing protein n=2 Tax=Empedobacter TaxID=59734 RepID=UPI0025784D60|nr:GEVED domain-containing protein [Empedobacter sp. 189-2]MDM1541815.1 T9SS sorting signal type C domain-containing protein [Empedobacter sp. 189-2]